jgi:hypothetical protein
MTKIKLVTICLKCLNVESCLLLAVASPRCPRRHGRGAGGCGPRAGDQPPHHFHQCCVMEVVTKGILGHKTVNIMKGEIAPRWR